MPGLTAFLPRRRNLIIWVTRTECELQCLRFASLIKCLVMSYVYRFADRILPNSVKFILRPLIAIIVITPLALLLIGPLGVTINCVSF